MIIALSWWIVNIFNYANGNALSVADQDIDVLLNKPATTSSEAVTWNADNGVKLWKSSTRLMA